MAIYLKGEDNEYHQTSAIPEGNYVLNTDETYCIEPDSEDKLTGRVAYDSGTQTLSVSTLTKKNTKCYLYFEEKELPLLNEAIKAQTTSKKGTFTGTSCDSGCNLSENGIYETDDDYGTSYYYRGTVDNNWVVFGTDKTNSEYIWWRIIRINGNDTIRLIYAGTSNSVIQAPETIGDITMITPRTPADNSYIKSIIFNTNFNDNKYVGYMYGGNSEQASTNYEEAHKPETESTILDEIKYWYENSTNLVELSDKIDVETGFCGDRTYTRNNHGSSYLGTGDLGYGNIKTVYGADKVWQSGSDSYKIEEQNPTLKCENTARDLYTGPKAQDGKGNDALPIPVGLITMDEVIYAGGFASEVNTGYWLYTNQFYWTMSPYNFNGVGAIVFLVTNNGKLSNVGVNGTINGARPVINLKADVTFKEGGNGTTTNPYIVNTD